MFNPREFEENVKSSFLKAKEHIEKLERAVEAQNERIKALEKRISQLINTKKPENKESEDLETLKTPNQQGSSGNDGVYSFIHSFTKHSFNNYALNTNGFKQDLEKAFSSLTTQEFLTFLTIYQLEEDLNRQPSYSDISNKLKLSEGCIRTYISSLIKKKIPLTKSKINNRMITVGIPKEFRELNLKQKLLSLFNRSDPEQTRLSDI